MLKKNLLPLVIFFTCLLAVKGQSQVSVPPPTDPTVPYPPASQYKVSWQRLPLPHCIIAFHCESDKNKAIKFCVDEGTRITIVFNFDPLNDNHELLTSAIDKVVYT